MKFFWPCLALVAFIIFCARAQQPIDSTKIVPGTYQARKQCCYATVTPGKSFTMELGEGWKKASSIECPVPGEVIYKIYQYEDSPPSTVLEAAKKIYRIDCAKTIVTCGYTNADTSQPYNSENCQ